jgi:putative flippase GtrA
VTLFERLRDSQFMRFAIVGGAGFFVNEAVLYGALHFLKMNPYVGAIFAFLLTVTFTWAGNRFLTFRGQAAHRVRNVLEEWFKFVAANMLGFCVNYAVYAALVRFAPPPLNSPYVALACGTLTGLVFNFTLSKRFVFRAS